MLTSKGFSSPLLLKKEFCPSAPFYDTLQREVRGHLNSFPLPSRSHTHAHIHTGIKMMEGGVWSNVRALQSSSYRRCTGAMCVLSNPSHCQRAMSECPRWLHWHLNLQESDSRTVSHSSQCFLGFFFFLHIKLLHICGYINYILQASCFSPQLYIVSKVCLKSFKSRQITLTLSNINSSEQCHIATWQTQGTVRSRQLRRELLPLPGSA